MDCCFACRSHPRIFISASFVPSFLVGYRKVYSGRREADVVMSSVIAKAAAAGQYFAAYCNFAYSALACFRMGMSGSASFQRVKKSRYAVLDFAVSPDRA